MSPSRRRVGVVFSSTVRKLLVGQPYYRPLSSAFRHSRGGHGLPKDAASSDQQVLRVPCDNTRNEVTLISLSQFISVMHVLLTFSKTH